MNDDADFRDLLADVPPAGFVTFAGGSQGAVRARMLARVHGIETSRPCAEGLPSLTSPFTCDRCRAWAHWGKLIA
jgi:hypothetical protein